MFKICKHLVLTLRISSAEEETDESFERQIIPYGFEFTIDIEPTPPPHNPAHTPAKSSRKCSPLEGNFISKPRRFQPFVDLIATLLLVAILSSQIFKSVSEKLKFSTKNIVCLKVVLLLRNSSAAEENYLPSKKCSCWCATKEGLCLNIRF